MSTPVIALNKLVRRQTPKSKYSHFTGTDRELIALVEQNFPLRKVGLKEGTITVPINAVVDGKVLFYSNIIQCGGNKYNRTEFVSKDLQDDSPRLSTTIYANKVPGKNVEIVLFSAELLKNYGKNSTNADYEILSINVFPGEQKSPPHPYSLLRMYRKNPQGFQKAVLIGDIMRSIDYWSCHAYIRNTSKRNIIELYDSDIIEQLIAGNKISAVKHLMHKSGKNIRDATSEIDKLTEALAEKGVFNEAAI